MRKKQDLGPCHGIKLYASDEAHLAGLPGSWSEKVRNAVHSWLEGKA
jgi:hypothetical protein